jgi:putative Holliday junction resolvase
MGRPRIVGVDFGLARVGLAVSDPLAVFAQPHGAFSPKSALAELEQIHQEDGIDTLVLGWPLELDGLEGPATDMVRAYEVRLRKTFPEIEIVRCDERFSSAEATETIVASGAKKKKRQEKGVVDAVAAAIILQRYLDQ